ncbi:hypothetical protein [Mycobacterium sp. E787]|uniref:hypothetical protein n=1 Tax=Mycobacterium sp. E787 TaxID=1834150 RepID=UPI0012EADA79|nr:hypothetical protein [Mycobacterium sp. E787]
MTITTRVASAAATVAALAMFAAPLAQADIPTVHAESPSTSCTDWGNYTVCRTTSYDIRTGEGYTMDCYYYNDGTSKCSCSGSLCS